MSVNLNTGTVRLVDLRTRVVEVLGPEPPGSRRGSDRELYYWRPQANYAEYFLGPRPIGFCFEADGRRARFIVDEGSRGDALLDKLAKYPNAPARPCQPYGTARVLTRRVTRPAGAAGLTSVPCFDVRRSQVTDGVVRSIARALP